MPFRFDCPPARKTHNGMFSQNTEFRGSQACPTGMPAQRFVRRAVTVSSLAGSK
jgi:hypothetical protein